MCDRDRAELKFTATYPDGEYNSTLEVVAEEDGLRIDDFILIPWEYIDLVREKFRG